jgi:hypothetical protein
MCVQLKLTPRLIWIWFKGRLTADVAGDAALQGRLRRLRPEFA